MREVALLVRVERDAGGKRIGYSNRVKPQHLLNQPIPPQAPCPTLLGPSRSPAFRASTVLHSGLQVRGTAVALPNKVTLLRGASSQSAFRPSPLTTHAASPTRIANRPGSYGFPSRTMATRSRRSLRQEPTSTCGFALRVVRRSWNSRRGAPFFESRHAARNRYRRNIGRPRLVMRVLPRNIPEEIV